MSLWSGTIIDFEKNGKLFGKNAEKLDTTKLKKKLSIKYYAQRALEN